VLCGEQGGKNARAGLQIHFSRDTNTVNYLDTERATLEAGGSIPMLSYVNVLSEGGRQHGSQAVSDMEILKQQVEVVDAT
jgi:hypothetical protein